MQTGEPSVDLAVIVSAFPEKKPGLLLWEPPSKVEKYKMILQQKDVTSAKMPQRGSSASFLGRGTALVCMEGHPGGSAAIWESEERAQCPVHSIKFYHSRSAASPREIKTDRCPGRSSVQDTVVKGEMMLWARATPEA